MNPSDVLVRSLSTADAPCVTSSFQADGVVLLHMLRSIVPRVAVLFLDTIHHFPETIAYRDEIARRWNLNLIVLRADHPHPGLWRESSNACCARHKVEPLFKALRSYDLWLTALRREQSPSRASLAEEELVALPEHGHIRKINPLAAWTTADIKAYADAHDIPRLALYDRGYTSIGCEPCTTLPADPMRARSGRWRGEKLECGIHVPRPALTANAGG